MNRTIKRIITFFMSMSLLASLTACSRIDGKYGILVESSQFYVGQTSKVSVLKIDTEETVADFTGWKSDNEEVAMVSDDGKIIGLKPGFANIYIEIKGEVMSTVVEILPLPDGIFNQNGEIIIGLPENNSEPAEELETENGTPLTEPSNESSNAEEEVGTPEDVEIVDTEAIDVEVVDLEVDSLIAETEISEPEE